MRVIAHIGIEKTGTTSIQSFLRVNRDALRARGVLVPRSIEHGETGNHRRLVAIVADPESRDDFWQETGLMTAAARTAQAAQWSEAFDAEIAASADCHTVLVTSEHLHSRLRTPPEIARLAGYLDARFDEVEVLVYLRDQIAMVPSILSTAVKSGRVDAALPDPRKANRALLDHRATLRRWADAFQAKRIDTKLFIPAELAEGDIVSDFGIAVGLDLAGLTRPPRQNESLSHLAMELLARINAQIPRLLPEGGFNPARGNIAAMIERRLGELPPVRLPADHVAALQETYAEANDWVRAERFPERSTLFPPRPVAGSAHSLPDGTTLDAMADLLVAMWRQKGPPGG